jgi:hypothetical protein
MLQNAKNREFWRRTFMIAIGLAAIVFVAMYVSEKAGFRRDLSKFKEVQGFDHVARIIVNANHSLM